MEKHYCILGYWLSGLVEGLELMLAGKPGQAWKNSGWMTFHDPEQSFCFSKEWLLYLRPHTEKKSLFNLHEENMYIGCTHESYVYQKIFLLSLLSPYLFK